jgi:hypothetical protein
MFAQVPLNTDSPFIMPFIILSVFGPGIAAFIVSRQEMSAKEFLKHTFTFEQRFSYYLIFVVWAVWRYLLCMMVGVRVEGSSLILPLIMLPMGILTGGAEEIGWRYLQPMMEKKMDFYCRSRHLILPPIISISTLVSLSDRRFTHRFSCGYSQRKAFDNFLLKSCRPCSKVLYGRLAFRTFQNYSRISGKYLFAAHMPPAPFWG